MRGFVAAWLRHDVRSRLAVHLVRPLYPSLRHIEKGFSVCACFRVLIPAKALLSPSGD